MSTDERESEASVSVTDEPGESELDARDAEAQARDRGRHHRCRPVQEAPQDHDSSRGDRASVRRVAREPAEGGGRPGLPAGPCSAAAGRQAVQKQVSDQVKSTLLMSSLEQIDEDYKLDPITQPRARRRRDRAPRKGPDEFRDGRRGSSPVRRAELQGAQGQAPGRRVTEKDVDEQLTRVPGAPRPDRPQAGRGRRDRRLSHGRPDLPSPGRAAA